MGPESTIMRTDIALFASAMIGDEMNELIVMDEYTLSGIVDLEASFLQCGKLASREVAGVHPKRRAQ
jgi:hypothetical protein